MLVSKIIILKEVFMDLIDAIILNDVNLAKKLIENGANLNYSDDNYLSTPLHFAAQYNRFEILKLLVTAGADITVKNKDGQSPFDIALLFEHRKIVKFLKEKE